LNGTDQTKQMDLSNYKNLEFLSQYWLERILLKSKLIRLKLLVINKSFLKNLNSFILLNYLKVNH